MSRNEQRSIRFTCCLFGVVLLALAIRVEAEVPDPSRPDQSAWARAELRADLQSLFHLRNDSDFDRTAPFYNESGQTVGAFATMFTPALTLHILDNLRIVYEVELGLNYWSKNNPDEENAIAADVFLLKHRQIFGEGEFLDGRLGFKVGYSHFREPTGLFVSHWIGTSEIYHTTAGDQVFGLFVGQVPDQVYEGILLAENNFRRDIWLFGGLADLPLPHGLRLSVAATTLYDSHLVNQRRWLVTPSVHLEVERSSWSGFIDLALQAGRFEGQALDNSDQTALAWAGQAGFRLDWERLELCGTVLALSPDDAHEGNSTQHAFLSSGKTKSATLILTEDEIRDRYDNIDEAMGAYGGGFFLNRAGLFVGDVKATWRLHDRIRPSLILGVGTVLKPENALDNVLVGVEGDLLVEFSINDYLVAHLVVGGLLPGGAGAALVNKISRESEDPVGMVETSLLLRY